MSWTAPYTWTGDEVLTASRMNAQVRDNLDYLVNVPIFLDDDGGAVTMTNNGTYYTDTSISCAAGTWLIWFTAECEPTDENDVFTFRIRNTTDSSTISSKDGATLPGASSQFRCFLTVMARVTFASTKTVRGECANTSTNGGTLDHSYLMALRVDV